MQIAQANRFTEIQNTKFYVAIIVNDVASVSQY